MRKNLGGITSIVYVLVSLTGCGIMGSSSGSAVPTGSAAVDGRTAILKSYQSEVAKHDGINQKEALLLAQSEVIFRGYDDEYRVAHPRLMDDDGGSHWRVLFYPVNKTMHDALHKPNVMVRVDKANGDVHWERVLK